MIAFVASLFAPKRDLADVVRGLGSDRRIVVAYDQDRDAFNVTPERRVASAWVNDVESAPMGLTELLGSESRALLRSPLYGPSVRVILSYDMETAESSVAIERRNDDGTWVHVGGGTFVDLTKHALSWCLSPRPAPRTALDC